ncbi:MAG: flagellar basal body rod C-terminal domain-containing protein [Pseudomonadota bacterium]
MTGSLAGLTGAMAFTGTGIIKVAVTDNTGMVVNTSNINLVGMTTVNDVLTALNGVAGLTASITVNGELSITAAPAPNGVSINELASTVTSSIGEGFSQYFGLNDMFTGTSAEDIDVSTYLKNGPQFLAIGVLSSTAIIGDRGVARGDGSIADQISDILNSSSTAFAAAGNFSAQSNSLISYVQAIMSDAASHADLAQQETDTGYQVFKASSELVTSKEGVNVDEETAKLLLQQNQYQAGAQVVKTVKDMMQTLIDAVR